MLLERKAVGVVDGVAVPAPRAPIDRPLEVVHPAPSSPAWLNRYRAAVVAVDTAAAAAVAAGVVATSADTHLLVSVCLAFVGAWPAVLAVGGAYAARVFGAGSDEYRRVLHAGLVLLALVGFTSYAGGLDLPRELVVAGLPLLTAASLVLRHAARQQLHRMRARGRCVKRVVVVGRGGAVLELADRVGRQAHTGLQVVAVCVTDGDRERVRNAVDVPVAGLDDVLDVTGRYGAHTVAVTSSSETAAEYLRRLSWQLEGTGIELLVAPGLIEVAGPRLHIRPYDGFPLLSVEQPRFEGWRRLVKGGVDRGLAALLLVLAAPVLLVIALAVGLSSPGPVLYRQERVGLNGRTFTMLKFRSMVVDAEERLEALREGNISDGLLFKMRSDPRVTPVGRWLRRLSLDELPQLLNVLGGSMSLVGPRPPLPREVAGYDEVVHRRLLVKPGLTGLWQISGRSDLSWDEAIRLDLRYVENWSLALDAQIMWKTARAVLTSSGAY